jgi:predicted nuclease of restriction endonuclease-like (RecB) superfamily
MHLLDRVPDPDTRVWYAQQATSYGWSSAILLHHIDAGLYERQGRSTTNFARTLPPAQSDLARQVLKDPYNFDFLSLGSEAQERELVAGS